MIGGGFKIIPPGKFHITPEKLPSQKEIHLPTIIFPGAMVNFERVDISLIFISNIDSFPFDWRETPQSFRDSQHMFVFSHF